MSETESQPVRKPADPFPTFAALRARHSELLELDPETDSDEGYLADVQDFFDRVRATGATLSAGEERRATQSILNYWTTVLYRADRKPSNTTLVELDPELKPKIADARRPYPGVREFDETEGKYFFGRQRTIDYLLARLKEEKFLALVGPSGSGKSSLVRAGLLPAIKNIGLGAEEDPGAIQRYFFPIITPGSNPLMNLASMLSKALDQPGTTTQDHYQKIRQDSKYLLNFLTHKIARPAVIVVDQFEELFTLCKDSEARRAFINNLLELENSKHRVILCSSIEDFGRDLKRLPEFEKVLDRGRTLLPRLGTSELSDAITKPADLVGFKFKDQTVKDIVQEIGTLPVALPLLQFTLVKLWGKRGAHDEYFSKRGGCRAILRESAEEFLRGLKPGEQRLAEQLFRRMVRFDYKYEARLFPVQLEAHSVPVRLQDLEIGSGTPEKVGVMVEQMIEAQLVRRSRSSTSRDVQVQLVHESLIQDWPRLAQWVSQQKWRRLRVASLSATALVILVVMGLVLGAAKALELKSNYDSHVQASKWARESRKHLNEGRLDTAMLLSLAAYQTDPSGEPGVLYRRLFPGETDLLARGALLSTLFYHPRPKAFYGEGLQSIGDIALSRDDRWLAANDNQGKIVIWNLSEPKDIGAMQDLPSQGTEIAPLIFSDDSTWLISGSAEQQEGALVGAATVWNATTRQQIKRLVAPHPDLSGFAGKITALALSRDKQKLAGLSGGRVVLWDTSTNKAFTRLGDPQATITALAFRGDGEILAFGDDTGKVVFWDVKRGRSIGTLTETKWQARKSSVKSIAFSPDGRRLAVSSAEETMLWFTSTDDEAIRLAISREGVGMILTFSEDGNTLAGFEGDKQVYLWDVTTPTVERIGEHFFQPITSAARLAFSRDGKTLASRGERGIALWDLSSDQRPLAGHAGYITDLAFSPDAGNLASSGNDGTVNLWHAVSGESIDTITNDSAALSLAFSHNGKLLAWGLLNGKILLRSLDDHTTFPLERGDQQEEQTAALLDQSAVAFSSDDKSLISVATRGDDVRLEEWDVAGKYRRGNPNRIPLEPGNIVTAVSLSPNGNLLALATDRRLANERDVLIWDTVKKQRTNHKIDKFATTIRSLEFSANGRWLVVGGNHDDNVFRYDLVAQEGVPIFLEGLSGDISNLAFGLDDKIVAVVVTPIQGDPRSLEAVRPGAIVLVDIEKPQVITEALRVHDSAITALASSRDRLATGSLDRMVLIWSLNTCQAKERICSVFNRSFTDEERKNLHLSACQIRPPVVRKECP